MILGLWSRGVVRQVYVDLITGFINTESTWNRMATGINEKSKQNPRFLYSSDRSKNVLRVRSRPVGLQPPPINNRQYGAHLTLTFTWGVFVVIWRYVTVLVRYFHLFRVKVWYMGKKTLPDGSVSQWLRRQMRVWQVELRVNSGWSGCDAFQPAADE